LLAATHASADEVDGSALPIVIIRASPFLHDPFYGVPIYAPASWMPVHPGMASAAAKSQALRLSDVCVLNVSAQAKSTTSQNDVTARWLTASEVYTALQAGKQLDAFLKATSKMTVVLNGVTYAGFQVTYADGWHERWPVSPNHNFSTLKLLDTPMPASLIAPAVPRSGCTVTG
jgi:hypothetical protein